MSAIDDFIRDDCRIAYLMSRDNRPMNLLAFDSSTERLYLGLRLGGAHWVRELAGGAMASATLIGECLSLLREGGSSLRELDAIGFGAGPGSFTGLRTACAVAQGLAFGANLPVVAVPTLMAVAHDARSRIATAGVVRICSAMDARMNELYVCTYVFDSNKVNESGDQVAISPEKLVLEPGFVLAGNAHIAYPTRLSEACLQGAVLATPTGAALLAVATERLALGHKTSAQDARPVYVRDKVAQTEAERTELKRAAAESLLAASA